MNHRDLTTLSQAHAVPMPMSVIPQNYAHPGLSMRQFLSIVRAYWRQSMMIAGVIFLAMLVFCIFRPKIYTATATLLVNFEVNDPLAGKEFPISLLGNYMATQTELMQSPVVLLQVVDKLKLADKKKYIDGAKGDADVLRSAAVKTLQKKLVIDQGHLGSQLIYINYSANNAPEAAEVVNTIAEIYTDREYQRSTAPATDRAQRYTAQLDELKAKVTQAQDQVTDYHRKTGLISTAGQIDIDVETLGSLERRLLEVQNAKRNSEVMTASNQAVGTQVLTSPVVQGLKRQLQEQQAKMAEYRATDGAKNPRVIELQSQINGTRAALSQEIGVYSGNAASELENNRQLEQKLQGAVAIQRAKVLELRRLKDEGEKYQLELDSAQTVYKRALDGYDQVSLASSSKYNNVSFVSRATPPAKPSSRKTIIMLLLGALSGIFFGIAGPFIYALFNRRVRCRDDIERDYGIPVLVEFSAITT